MCLNHVSLVVHQAGWRTAVDTDPLHRLHSATVHQWLFSTQGLFQTKLFATTSKPGCKPPPFLVGLSILYTRLLVPIVNSNL